MGVLQHLALTVFIFAYVADAKWHIEWHTPDQDVMEGNSITLMCRSAKTITDVTSNANWKTCVWKRERDSSYCLMEYKCKKNCHSIIHKAVWEVTTDCEAGLKNVTYFGSDPNKENHICGIKIPSAGLKDSSHWTCDLEECATLGGCGKKSGSGTHAQASMEVTVHEKVTTPPPTTTHRPVITTHQPIITTRRPVITTRRPVITTRRPVVTTRRPFVTSRRPVITTRRPVVTTRRPVITTRQPVITTQRPVVSTHRPVISTHRPVISTPRPVYTTRQPAITTSGPIRTPQLVGSRLFWSGILKLRSLENDKKEELTSNVE